MKITKLEHACLDITTGSTRLIIDPGVYASSLTDFTQIAALVITHVHADHFNEEKVKDILMQSPTVQIFTTQQVAHKLNGAQVTVPELGKQYIIGDITLEFFGGQHAKIIEGYPPQGADQNFGVLVSDVLYYPGDSIDVCPKPHAILAVPSMAPWLKTSEAVDFISGDTAAQVFPTHNHFLNSDGEDLMNRLLAGVAEKGGKKYTALKPGESIEA